MYCLVLIPMSLLFVGPDATPPGRPPVRTGHWRATLDTPGGELPFGMELVKDETGLRAWLINGSERSEVKVTRQDEDLVFDIEHYDSKITARPEANGAVLSGQWTKRRGPDRWVKLPFLATAGAARRFNPNVSASTTNPARFTGRWDARFSGSDEPAIGLFECHQDGTCTGTFLTTTGDYRFLAGNYDGDRIALSCFDGAHAFLFDARVAADGTLRGDFWSGDTWHETWTATRDPSAALPDPFSLTQATGNSGLADVEFKGLDGKSRRLTEPAFAGAAQILEVFGSWCPNCNDATAYLSELDRRYRARGLSIVGLAFELTGDFDRDVRQVRAFARLHKAEYPILMAGMSDKEKASKALPLVDRIRAYPTIIFLDRTGRVRAVYTGFSGPATGEAHRELRDRFETLIESLLASPGPTPTHAP